ncbi:hypothetical protein [Haloferula sp. BvORR071]|uniref:hypothetical protein n=1 Tax=Haloferula sp. BvORR071 TaxID=1396141 RepID=UPI00054D45AF|nr:hypothetical protein [Haloferula sp. BvORR071]
MSTELKVVEVESGLGIVLPDSLLEKLGLVLGDSLTLTETARGFALSAAEDEFSRQMRLAEEIMREDRDVLHLLAQ